MNTLEAMRKCRAGISIENARNLMYQIAGADQQLLGILDRLAGEIRLEVATELGLNYEKVWEASRNLNLFDDQAGESPYLIGSPLHIDFATQQDTIQRAAGEWEISRTNGRRRPVDPHLWHQAEISLFLQCCAINLGLSYTEHKFMQREGSIEGNMGDRDAARILDYLSWLHPWIQDLDTIAAPVVFRVLQSELERLAGDDSAALEEAERELDRLAGENPQ